MSGKHFTLDVEPGALRAAARRLGHLAETLTTRSAKVAASPGEIGQQWVGPPATAVMAEMTALGTVLSGFGASMAALPEALHSLAKDYEGALDQLPGLNQRWEQAEQDYQDAITAAGNALDQGRKNAKGDDGKVSSDDADALKQSRDDAVAAAAGARQTTMHNLELEFGHLRQFLGYRTHALGTALADSGPLDVTEAQMEQWRNGVAPVIDRSPLFDSLILTRQREVELVTPDVEDATDALRDAIESGDPQAVNDALDEIAEHADDSVWTDALAHALTPEQMQDLYLDIDEGLRNSTLHLEDVWPHLKDFNETVAQAVGSLPDDEFADYLATWMAKGYGPKLWALIAGTESADGRITAAALAHHSGMDSHDLDSTDLGMPGLFPGVFGYLYPDGDWLDQWADRSSGDDLARLLEHLDPDQVEDLMQRMHTIDTRYGPMDQDDYRRVADLYNDAIEAMFEHAASDENYSLWPLVTALEAADANSNRPPFGDMLEDFTDRLVRNPELMIQLIQDAEASKYASKLVDLLDRSGVSMKTLMTQITEAQLARGDDPVAAAAAIGTMLRAKELLGEEFRWGGVVLAVFQTVIDKSPAGIVNGFVGSTLSAVAGEYQRLKDLKEDFDESSEARGVVNQLAFALYVRAYGEPPGFADYASRVAASGSNLTEEEVVNRYIANLRADSDHKREWKRLDDLREAIDDSHD